jgi:hypothetical protein
MPLATQWLQKSKKKKHFGYCEECQVIIENKGVCTSVEEFMDPDNWEKPKFKGKKQKLFVQYQAGGGLKMLCKKFFNK